MRRNVGGVHERFPRPSGSVRAGLPRPRCAGPPARPGMIPFRKARSFDIHVSGGEYNVAAGLSDCFGLRTGIATAMVELPHRRTGAGAGARDRRHAVLQVVRARRRARPEHRHGLQRPRPRRPRRRWSSTTAANEAGALLKPGDFDWAKIFAGGVRWFHSGGIFAALSETTLGADHRRDAGRQGGRRHHLVRPQLPGQALGVGRRRRARPAGHAAHRRSTSTR